MTDLEMLLVAILAMLGALVAAYLGWANSGEPFNARKFSSSVIRAIVAALLFVAGSYTTQAPANFLVYLGAFLGGAGVDVLGNRLAGAVGYGSKTIPPSQPQPPQ